MTLPWSVSSRLLITNESPDIGKPAFRSSCVAHGCNSGPTKVVRTALQNAGSIAALMLTTEALVSELPEEKKAAPMPGGHGGGMGDMY